MLFLVLFLLALFTACGVGIMAARSDCKGMIIPNMYVLVVPLTFAVAFAAAHFGGADAVFGSLKSHVLAGVIALLVTFLMYAVKVWGAGDSKLVAAYALWFGPRFLLAYLFYVTLAGALLGLFALYVGKKKPFKKAAEGGWIARLQSGEKVVPYGVAIAAGAILGFVKAGYFGLPVLQSFFAG